jgi:hypothetical protein
MLGVSLFLLFWLSVNAQGPFSVSLGNNTLLLQWAIDGNSITVKLTTSIVSWAGIGWHKFNATANPTVNMMDVDFAIAIADPITNQIVVTDRFSNNQVNNGKTAPVLDTTLGGTNDIISYNGAQTATSTIFSFTKLLNTADLKGDWPIANVGFYHIVYASGTSNTFDYHGPGVYHRGNWLVNFFTGYNKCCLCL